MSYTTCANKFAGSVVKSEFISNQQLTEELHKSIIRKFQNGKCYHLLQTILVGADFVYMQYIGKFEKRMRFLFCVIYSFSKFAWVVLKDKKGATFTDAFQTMSDESNCKQNKIWLDKESKFYDRSVI